MARSVHDPEHKALRILATLFTWATDSWPAYVEDAANYSIFGRR
jgi:hypothetical protein